jgi:uncharacterized protein (TIGR03083 family)
MGTGLARAIGNEAIMTSVPPDLVRHVVEATAHRSACIADALSDLSTNALEQPSLLPDWTRLTIACHLRYGAQALIRMSQAAISGKPTAYYPDGREVQRPRTLAPAPGEEPHEVIVSLRSLCRELNEMWAALDTGSWDTDVIEPADQPDFGPVPLSTLPSLRLTEVEVHGSDLDLGLEDWSELFVSVALPTRLRRLNVRRTNHRQFDRDLQGTWLLAAVDGPTFAVSVQGDVVEAQPASPNAVADAVIEATSRDLLALLLGRPLHDEPRIRGNVQFGNAFHEAFPGP